MLFLIETRQEEGLHVLLNTAVQLIEDNAFEKDDIVRLLHALSDLRTETKYSNILLDSRRAVSISLVREQCVRLAHSLKQRTVDDGTLEGWLEEGLSDALPEVRFALQTG